MIKHADALVRATSINSGAFCVETANVSMDVGFDLALAQWTTDSVFEVELDDPWRTVPNDADGMRIRVVATRRVGWPWNRRTVVVFERQRPVKEVTA
jgi:hypothetical protein